MLKHVVAEYAQYREWVTGRHVYLNYGTVGFIKLE